MAGKSDGTATRFAAAFFSLLAAAGGACQATQPQDEPRDASVSDAPHAYQTGLPGEPCSSDAEACPDGQFCDFADAGACGATGNAGTCKTIPQACPFFCSPVCGCNGVTYDNGCWASHYKVTIFEHGFCLEKPAVPCWQAFASFPNCNVQTAQQDCNTYGDDAGNNGPIGNSNMYCDAPDGGPNGQCEFIPDNCNLNIVPVCGTDGRTYRNECEALWEGRVASRPGACQ